MKKVIINFCPTGMVPTKSLTPHVPISPSEIVDQVHEAWECGITIAHLHARNKDEKPTWEPEVYREIFEGVRKHCKELIICGSTSGRDFNEFEKRSAVIELMPDMCSLTLSSLNFMQQASVNSPHTIMKLAEKMNSFGVIPELECFDLGMINYGQFLIKKGIIKGPHYWNLIFGNIAGFQPDLLSMGTALSLLNGDENYVGIGGLGHMQLTTLMIAISMGYGVRVGIEDNIWWNRKAGEKCTNLQLLKRTHDLLNISGAELFTAKELGNIGFYNRKRNEN